MKIDALEDGNLAFEMVPFQGTNSFIFGGDGHRGPKPKAPNVMELAVV